MSDAPASDLPTGTPREPQPTSGDASAPAPTPPPPFEHPGQELIHQSQPIPPPYAASQHQAPGAYPYPVASGYMVAPKNPAIAVLLSFFVPGVGSLTSGSTVTGTIILVGWLVSIPLMLVCIGFFSYFGFWIWGMIDAYSSAQRWNRERGIIS